ncbi:hypothetical protein HanRHA438_Chr12g0557711 [Helianthus annuus]|nr:hypothetical protein HanIR_Chr12g0589461 [Helianthus annuus]KAJ0866964.1 hypothetical protein HanRHA438_Chr12g0557711 [Helianthus annuus]
MFRWIHLLANEGFLAAAERSWFGRFTVTLMLDPDKDLSTAGSVSYTLTRVIP